MSSRFVRLGSDSDLNCGWDDCSVGDAKSARPEKRRSAIGVVGAAGWASEGFGAVNAGSDAGRAAGACSGSRAGRLPS